MIVHDLVGTEDNQAYRILEAQNLVRQYDFAHSLYQAATALSQAGQSHEKLKALNFHGIACLHNFAGQYRPHDVVITNAPHRPPPHAEVPRLMDVFIAEANHLWSRVDPITLAAFVLWRLNWIHPFVNGNGRTARVAAYYTICRRYGLWMPGSTTLPELISQSRDKYYAALRELDASHASGSVDLRPMADYLSELLQAQLQS